MGLDASVSCNCFRYGKTSPPPFPNEWLVVGDDGQIDLIEGHGSVDNWLKLDAWSQSCCPHENMEIAAEHISNWPGYRLFQEALGKVGWLHFPALYAQLPNSNDGFTPPAESRKALLEVEKLSYMGEIGQKTVLVNSDTGEELYERVNSYDGVFICSGSRGVNVGFDDNGVFVVNRNTNEELFRARKIRQFNRSGIEMSLDSDDLAWEDLETGRVYLSRIALHGRQVTGGDGAWDKPRVGSRFAYPIRVHVEQRVRTVSDFDYIIKALKSVFAASVETGNPVRWC